MSGTAHGEKIDDGGGNSTSRTPQGVPPSLTDASFSPRKPEPQGYTPIDLSSFTLGREPLPLTRLGHYRDFATIAEGLQVELMNRNGEDWLDGGLRLQGELFLGVPGTVEVVVGDDQTVQATLHTPGQASTELTITDTRFGGRYQSLDLVKIELLTGCEVEVSLSASSPTTQANPFLPLSIGVSRGESLYLVAELWGYPTGRQELNRLRAEKLLPSAERTEVQVSFSEGTPTGVALLAYLPDGDNEPPMGVRTTPSGGIEVFSQGDDDAPRALKVLAKGANDVRRHLAELIAIQGE